MPGPVGASAAARTAKRLYPLARAAYRRWDQLSPEEKERYMRQARRYAGQGAGYARVAISKVPRGPLGPKPKP
jgi:hypothetical protein